MRPWARLILFLVVSGAVCADVSFTVTSRWDQLTTPEERKAIGIERLNARQRAAFEEWAMRRSLLVAQAYHDATVDPAQAYGCGLAEGVARTLEGAGRSDLAARGRQIAREHDCEHVRELAGVPAP
jgi:hypothetical protein